MCALGGNADDTLHPVRKALRRAEARPKNLAKSMEDITASSLPSKHVFHIPSSNLHNARILAHFVIGFSQDKKEGKTPQLTLEILAMVRIS